MRDPYSILGVQKDAGNDEIKAAWRTKAKTVHPDQNRDDPDATARFAEIGQAYDLLKDPKKRGLYDQARRAAESKRRDQTIMQQREAARQAAERAKAAEKLMEELARAQERSAKSGTATGAAPGAAQAGSSGDTAKPETAEDMLERIFGADAKAKAAAGKTDASSSEEASDKAETASPAGSGFLSTLIRRIRGIPTVPEKAPDMTAEAVVSVSDLVEQKWITIKMPDERDVRFQLEAGMTDGHSLRLKGQGLKLPEVLRGDLVVTILVSRTDEFTVREHDIHTTLPISLADAVLGCEAAVKSPRGELSVSIPAWSGSDKTIRVEGKGLQRQDGTHGDLVVELRIILLETPDAKVTDLMRHMREGLYL